ncbi:Uncharacterised protein [Chromobacterium violaceum]|uniref:Uncharacterized protein n=1 Tax=Chromobacterium violaceum TaxID=536 RepID=A0A3S4JVD5_CHRVL|nr:Uncharacterised protein [Chromobacterium violaceum]
MHLGNPKAILVWLSLVSLASPASGGESMARGWWRAAR